MNLRSILTESIEDKGILKAVFIIGIPGSGKTYTATKINDGSIQPRIVNTDKVYEFLSQTQDVNIGVDADPAETRRILDTSKQLTRTQLLQYINSLLPLFIDSTSFDAPNILRRIGLLEGFGYDVGMVWVHSDLNVALERARSRERYVDEDFITRVYEKTEKNAAFLKTKVAKFVKVENNGELDNAAILNAYRAIAGFFRAPISNPVGIKTIEDMRARGDKYLIPGLYSKEEMSRILGIWYKRRIK